jgi:NitT/TauT family transport system permease protein
MTRSGRWRERALFYLPSAATFVGVILLWEFAVHGGVLPRPSEIVRALIENWSSGRWPLFVAARNTFLEAMLGLGIGAFFGVLWGAAVARWTTARDALLPVAIAANAVPIIAFAPIMNNWFGVLNPLSKAAIAAVLVFFPIFINVVRGLAAVDPAAIELMRSYAVSEWVILRKVRIPVALPFFLTGLKVSTTLSLIGAIVAEYFGGSSDVIGRVVVQSASALRWDVSWAAIVFGATTGILFYLAIAGAERLLIPWHASVRGEGSG